MKKLTDEQKKKIELAIKISKQSETVFKALLAGGEYYFYGKKFEIDEIIESYYAGQTYKDAMEYYNKRNIKPSQDLFNSPDVPEWAKYIAVDESGKMFCYSIKPYYNDVCEFWDVDYNSKNQLIGILPVLNWRDTLIERENKSKEVSKEEAFEVLKKHFGVDNIKITE